MNAFPDLPNPEHDFHRAAEDYIADLRHDFAVSYAEAMGDVTELRSIGATVRESVGWIEAFAKQTHGKTKSPSRREVAELVVEMICGAYGFESAIPVVMAAFELGEPARKPEGVS